MIGNWPPNDLTLRPSSEQVLGGGGMDRRRMKQQVSSSHPFGLCVSVCLCVCVCVCVCLCLCVCVCVCVLQFARLAGEFFLLYICGQNSTI